MITDSCQFLDRTETRYLEHTASDVFDNIPECQTQVEDRVAWAES